MSENFPQDEFDQVAPATGIRRTRRSTGSKFFEFIAYFSLSAVVAGGALIGYQTYFGGSSIDVSSVADSGKAAAVDPIRINETTVFDGAGKAGLASSVAHKLIDKGWNVVTAANVLPGLKASKTVIYINSDSLKDAASTLVGDLGKYTVEVSNQYIDPITVVLGADYK